MVESNGQIPRTDDLPTWSYFIHTTFLEQCRIGWGQAIQGQVSKQRVEPSPADKSINVYKCASMRIRILSY